MDAIELTLEQAAEAERIEDVLMAGARAEIRKMARLLASKENSQLLGETEFQVRGCCHRIGARAIDTALEGRKKRGTTDRRVSASGAANG